MAKTKKRSLLAWIAVFSLIVGMILYVVSALIFPSKSILSWEVFVSGVVGCLLLAAVALKGDTLPGLLRDVCIVGGGLCVIVAISFFVLHRLEPGADIWFIPVNYPAQEEASLYVSCAGIACMFVGFIATVMKAFSAKD